RFADQFGQGRPFFWRANAAGGAVLLELALDWTFGSRRILEAAEHQSCRGERQRTVMGRGDCRGEVMTCFHHPDHRRTLVCPDGKGRGLANLLDEFLEERFGRWRLNCLAWASRPAIVAACLAMRR